MPKRISGVTSCVLPGRAVLAESFISSMKEKAGLIFCLEDQMYGVSCFLMKEWGGRIQSECFGNRWNLESKI